VGGRRVFPNAVVHVDKRELDFWTDKSVGENLPEPSKSFFQAVEKTVGPYIASNQIRTFGWGSNYFPSIRAVPAYGQYPGQSFYALENNGQWFSWVTRFTLQTCSSTPHRTFVSG